MKPNGTIGALTMGCIMACASTPPATTPVPVTAPSGGSTQPAGSVPLITPEPLKSTPRSGAWAFTYAPGTYAYTITTDATMAPISDSTQKRQAPELSQTATITISASGDVQVTEPLSVISGSCDANAALTVRAQQLITKLPNHLSAGDRWRDSTTTTGCRGIIPAESTVISNYSAVGDTIFANVSALQIQRIDSISASGEGVEGQHRILITAKGVAAVNLFFNVNTGRFVGSHGLQTSLVNITTSGRLTQFIQHVSESAVLVELQ